MTRGKLVLDHSLHLEIVHEDTSCHWITQGVEGIKATKNNKQMEMSIEHSFSTLTTMKMRNLRIKRMMKGVVGNNYISVRNIAMNYRDDT